MKKIILTLIYFTVLFGYIFGQSANEQQAESSGTGFFITNDGVIITCAHVIENGNRITVKINNTEYPAQVLNVDNETDLAVLKIDYRNPYHFKIADFTTLNLGDRLYVLGFPLPHILTADIRFTEGSLSARSGLKSDPYYFQHSAPTQPGNSGGPIFNSRYEVVGVVAAIINDTFVKRETGTNPQNINFGVKSGSIIPLLNNIRPGNGNIQSISDAEKATPQILCYYSGESSMTTMTVANNTGYMGMSLFVSPASDPNWGPDRLEDAVLRSGRTITLNNVPASANNRYDIRLVDEDDDSYTKWDVQIMPNQSVEFTFDDFDNSSSGQTAATYNGPPVTIVNNTGYVIYYLYVSPATSDSWGEDRLAADQVIGNRETVSVRLPHAINEVNKYDIMIVDSDGDTYSKYNVTLTANGTVTFTIRDLDR